MYVKQGSNVDGNGVKVEDIDRILELGKSLPASRGRLMIRQPKKKDSFRTLTFEELETLRGKHKDTDIEV